MFRLLGIVTFQIGFSKTAKNSRQPGIMIALALRESFLETIQPLHSLWGMFLIYDTVSSRVSPESNPAENRPAPTLPIPLFYFLPLRLLCKHTGQ